MVRKLALLLVAVASLDCHSPASAPPPASAAAPVAPAPPSSLPATIDARLRREWALAGITPASRADDARFLRRAYIDIAGVIPPAERVVSFLADAAPDKRARLVDELLASPLYADHWAHVYDRLLLGSSIRPKVVDRVAFRGWLRDRFAENMPYDALARALITASGQNSAGGKPWEDPGHAGKVPEVNGAVNWILRYAENPPDLAGTASRVFLGVQIQCAQCHDHKTEAWKSSDFRGLTAAFMKTTVTVIDKGKVDGIRRIQVEDGKRWRRSGNKGPDLGDYLAATPRALDGTDLSQGPSPRKNLADWMTSPQNPWFARAFVNRLWAHFLGHGFVDPVDDLRPGNPGELPDLLDVVAADLVASRYDIKHLIRLLCATEAYGLASSGGGAEAPKLWSRFRIEPMKTDELLGSILAATGVGPVLERVTGRDREAIELSLEQRLRFVFDVDEEAPDDGPFDGTITQALFLENGVLMSGATSAAVGAALTGILEAKTGDDAKITSLYERTLSRPPSADELSFWIQFVNAPRQPAAAYRDAPPATRPQKAPQAGKDPTRRFARGIRSAEDAKGQAYEDLFWALLNASEFVMNH